MKKIYFVLLVTFYSFSTFSREPFVVLEHSSNNYSTSSKIDIYNPFLKDSSYSQIHMVRPGDSLSAIINKYYKNTGLNMRIVELSIVEINKKAFVRNNPNYLYAGKKIKIPSINEIMNLVMNKSDKNQKQNSSSHIYFFGGN